MLEKDIKIFFEIIIKMLEMNLFCLRTMFGLIIFGFIGLKSASTLFTRRFNIFNRNSMKLDDLDRKSICVIGGGFGGLYTALSISNKIDKNTDVYLIDPKDNFVFSPLLYELAVGTASPVEVAPRYSTLLKGTNVKFIKAEVNNIDFQQQNFDLKIMDNSNDETINIPSTLKYDQIVISTGIQPRTDLIPGAKEHTLPFYRVNDAFKLKAKLKELKTSKKDSLNVVVIGGGYSGVEVATNIAQELKKALVTIIDRNATLMLTSTKHNRNTAISSIEKKGIQTLYNTSVKLVQENSLELVNELGVEYNMPADLIVFTAGTEQSQFIKDLSLTKDKFGRILVNKFLQSIDYRNVFSLGDCCTIENEYNPATAQVAMQQASTVSYNIIQNIKNYTIDNMKNIKLKEFKFLNLGEMLTLGDTNAAITSLNGWLKLSGPIAAAGRRAIYAVRMPTITQSVKAFLAASTVTTGKLISKRLNKK